MLFGTTKYVKIELFSEVVDLIVKMQSCESLFILNNKMSLLWARLT